MDGNEEGDSWGDIDPGDFVWEQEAASLSMFEPPPFTADFCDIWENKNASRGVVDEEEEVGGTGELMSGDGARLWGRPG